MVFRTLIVLCAGLNAVPAMAREVDAHHVATPATPVESMPKGTSSSDIGKAGVDRFEMRMDNIRESVRADGTIIVELNGEGMERMVMSGEAGSPRVVCESMLERSMGKSGSAPGDFRAVRRPLRGVRHDDH